MGSFSAFELMRGCGFGLVDLRDEPYLPELVAAAIVLPSDGIVRAERIKRKVEDAGMMSPYLLRLTYR